MAKNEEKKEEKNEAATEPAKTPAAGPKKGTFSRFVAFNGKNYKPGDAVPEGFIDWIKKTKREAANYIQE